MLKNKLKNKKKGFTLIELIVVLAVLAIIALIAIPNFNQIRENSKIKSDQRSADLIDKAVTTLVQDDDGTIKDGTYLYNQSKTVTGTDANTVGAITGVLGQIEPAQQDGALDYSIVIDGVGTTTPTVVVTVGTFSTTA
ncbi:MAG: pilus assembly FimT family protein [Sarcina sp.]